MQAGPAAPDVVTSLSSSDEEEVVVQPLSSRRLVSAVDLTNDDDAGRRDKRKRVQPPLPQNAEVIDLEAATGPGLGVSGKPLLPGELEARQQRVRKSWCLIASRSTDDAPEESHYRFAESAWCRGGGAANQIAAIEYHFNPTLEAAWHAKRAEYDRRFGVGGHTILFAFHGTRSHNVQPILAGGFDVAKVGSTTDAGFFGAGIYFSEHFAHSQGYNSGNAGMFLCKLLVGKPFLCPHAPGRGLAAHGVLIPKPT